MNYKLAKELRDAGFPQGGRGTYVGPSDSLVWKSGDRVYVPTLSELIEALPKNRFSLHRVEEGWIAQHVEIPDSGRFYFSPEEAVADLWLVLNVR
jgi:hypothetical protein